MGISYINRINISIGLLSTSMIAFQLSLMQYLSIVQWHHFAYMIIGIALLGFGAAGTFLAIFKKRLVANLPFSLPLLISISGISMPLSVWLSGQPIFRFDTYLLFVEQSELWKLLLFELLFFVPFFSCALAIGIVFIKFTDKIGQLYFSNLAGSGLGGILIIGLFWLFNPALIPVITGLLAILASFVLLVGHRNPWLIKLNIITLAGCLILAFTDPLNLNISQYKGLSRSLDLPETSVKRSENSPFGWVQYVSSNVIRYAPGLSLSYTGDVPVVDLIFNNADGAGAVLSTPKDSEILDFTTSGAALAIKIPEKVLVLGAGTGVITHYFSQHDNLQIDHVEPNPIVNKFSSDASKFLGNVTVYSMDARYFLSNSQETYDIISLPDIGEFGGSAGLNAIQENYLLTIDSFSSMYDSLDKDGILTVTVWIDYPYRNPLKLTATFIETLAEKGIDNPGNHLAAIRSWNTITYLLKREEFNPAEIAKLEGFSNRLSFDPLLLPGLADLERNNNNFLEDENLFRMTDSLITGTRTKVYTNYDFNLKPATDDRPYFSQFLKWKNFRHLQDLFGDQSASFFELGYLILVITFIQSLFLAVFLIILPLIFLRRKVNNKLWVLLYFSGIGIGFMFVEIVMIQRFILFLGNPVYSVAAVICFMLVASGIGSWYSSRLKTRLYSIQRITFLIFVIIAVYAFGLPAILNTGMRFSLGIKILYVLILIGIPSFFMGMPFPLGLKYLSENNAKAVPWAWGINGCLSVISASLATIFAIEAGFSIITFLGAAAYLVTMASCFIPAKT